MELLIELISSLTHKIEWRISDSDGLSIDETYPITTTRRVRSVRNSTIGVSRIFP